MCDNLDPRDPQIQAKDAPYKGISYTSQPIYPVPNQVAVMEPVASRIPSAHSCAVAARPALPSLLRYLLYNHSRDRLALYSHPHNLAGSHAKPLHRPDRLFTPVP